MPPDRTDIRVNELVELRRKAVAHDDYVEAMKLLKLRAYSLYLDDPLSVEYRKGYNAAVLDMTEAIVQATMRRLDEEGG